MTAIRWQMLALLFLARTAMGFQFQSVGSIGPILVGSPGFTYGTVGTLIGLYLLPGAFFALPGGVLGERYPAKHLVVAGLAMMMIGGLLMAASDGLAMLAGGRLLSGVGGVLMNVLLTKMAADWFAGGGLATAMAVLVTSWPVGIALGLLGFAPLAAGFGWPAAMILPALVCAVCLAAIALLYRDPPTAPALQRRGLKLDLSPREWTLVSLAGLTWAIYNVAYILLVSFLPGYLVGLGYALPGANALASWLGWALVAFVPVGGILADRLSRPDLVMTGGFALSVGALLLMAVQPAELIFGFVIVAIVIGMPAGPIMAMPVTAVRPHNKATGMGIFFTWYYVLMAIFPAIAGFARDATGNAAVPLIVAAITMAAALVTLAGFRALARNPAWLPAKAE
jgi:predicted MFS family arabinose efflux permease